MTSVTSKPISRINGASTLAIDPLDRGLRYGDGLFETIAWRAGRLEFLGRHVARMQEGAARLRISLDAQSASLRDAVEADFESMWIEAGRPDEAVLRVQITRGSGGRGYAVSGAEIPTRISTLHPWPWQDSNGTAIEPPAARLRFCQQTLAAQPALAGIKHSNRLEQVLARMEWGVGADAAFDEGLMSDAEGRIIEGTMSNVFVL
ncbi:MAG: aminotransferase class IV, partial [Gammaproteobacteria bacterium]